MFVTGLFGVASAQDSGVTLDALEVWSTAPASVTVDRSYRATAAVSATRTATPLRDVPQSVQVVTREVLREQNALTLSDAVINASGVVPGNTRAGQTEVFNIRGFAVRRYAINGVLLNPLAERPQGLRDTVNVARVEVLKGPASVLYGRGDPGGLVNVVTLLPEFEPAATVTADGGSFGFARMSGTATGALNSDKTLAGRLSFAAQRTDGFRNEIFGPSERVYVAPSFLYKPDGATQVILDLEYGRQSVPFDRGLVAVGAGVPFRRDAEFGEAYSRQGDEYASATWRASHSVNDWLTLRHVGRVDHGDNDRFSVDPRGANAAGTELRRRVLSSRERFASIDLQFEALATFDTWGIGHTALLGYEYNRADTRLSSFQAPLASISLRDPAYGARPGRFTRQANLIGDAELHAVYLQDQIDLGAQWKLLAGVRVDSVGQAVTDIGTDARLRETAATPRFGLVYRPIDTVSLYASYAESFFPQPGRTRAGEAFAPERGEQYEVGVKLDLIPNQLSATVAAFELTRRNVLTRDPVDPEFSIVTGAQRSRGVEFDVTGEILPGWNVLFGGAYLEAKVAQDEVIPVGNRLEGVPQMSGRLWTTYRVQDGALRGLGFGGGFFAVGDRAGDIDNTFTVPGFVRLDATIYYDISDTTRVSLNAINLTDETYILSVAGRNEVIPGAPFNVMGRVSARF